MLGRRAGGFICVLSVVLWLGVQDNEFEIIILGYWVGCGVALCISPTLFHREIIFGLIDNRFPWKYALRFPIWGGTDSGGEKEDSQRSMSFWSNRTNP